MSLLKSSGLFAAGTLLSRVSGLVRDQVILAVFGASHLQDAFTVAFRIPNLLRDMLAEGALGNAFTKVYSSLSRDDPGRAQDLLVKFLQLTFLASLVLCSAGIVLAPQLVALMTTFGSQSDLGMAADPQFIHNTVGLTRVLFPYLGLAVLGAVVMGALHQGGRFFLSAVAPMGFNIGNIIGALVLARFISGELAAWIDLNIADHAITGLAIGTLLGGLAQLGMQSSGIWRSHLRGRLNFKGLPWNSDIKRVLILMLPAAIAASSGPINVTINTNFATTLPAGSVSWLNFAFRLLQLPVGIFGVAVSVAILPALAREIRGSSVLGTQRISEKASQQLQRGVELVLWALTPCFIFLLINALPLIDALFRHGHFTQSDAIRTSEALFAYSFGLLAYGLIKVFTSFYFAVERTTYAMVVSLFSIAVNYIGNSILVDKLAFQGLAYTASLSLTINALILAVGLLPHQIHWDYRQILKSAGILSLAAASCFFGQKGVFYLFGASDLLHWYENATKIEIYGLLSLNILLTIGLFLGFAAAYFKKHPFALLQKVKRSKS